MDKLTVGGLIAAVLFILVGAYLESGIGTVLFIMPWSHAGLISAFIVFGGTGGTICVRIKKEDVPGLKEHTMFAIKPPEFDFATMHKLILDLAQRARREGILALEQSMNDLDDEFLTKALRLTIDGQEKSFIEDALYTEIELEAHAVKASAKIWSDLGAICPTIGILGAVLGLISTMGKLGSGDIGAIGGGISAAFVATLYGVGFANVVCIPFQKKIERTAEFAKEYKEMMMVGVIGISEGLNPMLIQEKLDPYVHGDHGAHEEGGGGDE